MNYLILNSIKAKAPMPIYGYSTKRTSLADKIGKPLIDKVVDDFYNKIQGHKSLSKPFESVDHWDEHKEKIAHFWWVALGGIPTGSYQYDPVGKHFTAGFNLDLLEDWKALFSEVCSRHLDSGLAQEWGNRVQLIGDNLLRQNNRLSTS